MRALSLSKSLLNATQPESQPPQNAGLPSKPLPVASVAFAVGCARADSARVRCRRALRGVPVFLMCNRPQHAGKKLRSCQLAFCYLELERKAKQDNPTLVAPRPHGNVCCARRDKGHQRPQHSHHSQHTPSPPPPPLHTHEQRPAHAHNADQPLSCTNVQGYPLQGPLGRRSEGEGVIFWLGPAFAHGPAPVRLPLVQRLDRPTQLSGSKLCGGRREGGANERAESWSHEDGPGGGLWRGAASMAGCRATGTCAPRREHVDVRRMSARGLPESPCIATLPHARAFTPGARAPRSLEHLGGEQQRPTLRTLCPALPCIALPCPAAG